MLSLPAELTHVQANACLAQLAAGVKAEGAVVALNAEPLQRFDSSALAVLLEFQRTCAGLGKTVVCAWLAPATAGACHLVWN